MKIAPKSAQEVYATLSLYRFLLRKICLISKGWVDFKSKGNQWSLCGPTLLLSLLPSFYLSHTLQRGRSWQLSSICPSIKELGTF